jgi:hypothetical protein
MKCLTTARLSTSCELLQMETQAPHVVHTFARNNNNITNMEHFNLLQARALPIVLEEYNNRVQRMCVTSSSSLAYFLIVVDKKTFSSFKLLNSIWIALVLTHSQVPGVNPLEGSPKCSCGKLGLGRRSRLPTLERGRGSSWEPMD